MRGLDEVVRIVVVFMLDKAEGTEREGLTWTETGGRVEDFLEGVHEAFACLGDCWVY